MKQEEKHRETQVFNFHECESLSNARRDGCCFCSRKGESVAGRKHVRTHVLPMLEHRPTCPGSWVLGPGSWVLGPGSWVLGPGSWVLGPGSWVLGPGSWVLGLWSQVLCAGSLVLVPGSWFLVPGSSESWVLSALLSVVPAGDRPGGPGSLGQVLDPLATHDELSNRTHIERRCLQVGSSVRQ